MARPKKNTNKHLLADKMRRAVLQAAIEGKLTEQHPITDGYARDLLADIESEKQRLIKAGEIKREKSPTLITEEEKPFDIPDNWEWVRLDQLSIYIQRGRSPKYSSIEEIPVISQKCVQWSGFSLELAKFIDPETKEKYQQERFLQDGDLLWNSTGLGTVGRVAKYREERNKYDIAVADSHVTVVRLLKQYVLAEYVELFIASPIIQQNIEDICSGSTKQKELATSTVKKTVIPLPPLAEQQRIVAKLKAALAQIDSLHAHENALYALQTAFPRQIQASLLQAAIEGKLTQQDATKDGNTRDLLADIESEKLRMVQAGEIKRQKTLPPIIEEEKPFDIPDNWEWVRLGSISNYGQSKKVNPNDIPSKSLVIEMEDIEKETFQLIVKNYDRTPRSSKSIFKQGDVLYGKLRPYLKKIIVADDEGYCSTEIIPFNGFGKIDSNYLKLCMSSPAIDNYVNSLTHGMDMPRLGTDKAINLLIPLPPLAEQQRIVDLLEQALPEIQTLKEI